MTRNFSLPVLSALLFLSACSGNKTKSGEASDSVDSTMTESYSTVPEWEDKDSTIYGRAEGFGQSAFTLVANDGREFDIALTSEKDDDPYGEIYGDREDTARYAVTTRDNDENLSVMINLSQLEKYTKDYEIYNCHLILNDNGRRDLVTIIELNDSIFSAKGLSGKDYLYHR